MSREKNIRLLWKSPKGLYGLMPNPWTFLPAPPNISSPPPKLF